MTGNGKISISVSGGAANIGSVSQGDGNRVTVESQSLSAELSEAFGLFVQDLARISASGGVDRRELEELSAEVASLRESMESGADRPWATIARSLYERYGWAAGALKKLFAIVLP